MLLQNPYAVTEIVKLINKYGHSASYDSLEEIEFALRMLLSRILVRCRPDCGRQY